MIVGSSRVNVLGRESGIRPTETWIPMQPSHLCDFWPFSYQSQLPLVQKQWTRKLRAAGYRVRRESRTVAGLGNIWNEGSSRHLGCRNDSLLRLLLLKWCCTGRACPRGTGTCQESDSQCWPSVQPRWGLLPGAGGMFCWTAYQDCSLWVGVGILQDLGWK